MTETVEKYAVDQVEVVDVGGDVFARGDEPKLLSPLPDALVIAACATAGVPASVRVAGPGLDGEIPEPDLLAADHATLTEADTRSVEHVFLWHPSEASALLAAAARGLRGGCVVRDTGKPVILSDASARVYRIPLGRVWPATGWPTPCGPVGPTPLRTPRRPAGTSAASPSCSASATGRSEWKKALPSVRWARPCAASTPGWSSSGLRTPFFGHAESRALGERLSRLCDLLLALPHRLHDGDLRSFTAALGWAPETEATTQANGIPRELPRCARADLYREQDGFRLLELNGGSPLGGWDISLLNQALLQEPYVASFARRHGLSFTDGIKVLLDLWQDSTSPPTPSSRCSNGPAATPGWSRT
ncbi:DUF1152 domain-containing protein [Streptomyces sp. NPDC006662]|uniref:DUF1152 domain-containing protein n=1 Tax=Streptomyces sp. NPDC006662 TaxID=3156902 RepID=UPI0033C20DB9